MTSFLAFVKYCAASSIALLLVALLCAMVQQWDEQGAGPATNCRETRCT
jgi:hypothetical protein